MCSASRAARIASWLTLAVACGSSLAGATATEVVTVAISPSTEPGPGSGSPSMSQDGSYVAFESTAANLVADDTNEVSDVFVYDRTTAVTIRVSVDSLGGEGNAPSYEPSMSRDGSVVAFRSEATNLVAGDTNARSDIFVRDNLSGTITRVSVDGLGAQGNDDSFSPSVSVEGRYVAFVSRATNLVAGDTNARADVFVRDRFMGTTTRVSVHASGAQADADSLEPAISANGLVVAFHSSATNLVDGDTNACTDVFLYYRSAGTTDRVSVDTWSAQGNDHSYSPSISADGRYVTFYSSATNLVAGDTNGVADVFVRDTVYLGTTRVSVDGGGTQGNGHSFEPAITEDGRYVTFISWASNFVAGDTNGALDVFVRDQQTGGITRASVSGSALQGNGNSTSPAISGTGRYVAFMSWAQNLVPGDTNDGSDIFVRDRQIGSIERAPDVSQPPPAGAQLLADGSSSGTKRALSANGRYVAFASVATNLVAGDTNGRRDIFVRDLRTGITTRVSVDSVGAQANNASYGPSISGDGRYVAFYSYATNLVAADTNLAYDVFVHDRVTGATTRASVDSGGSEGNGDSYPPSISDDGRYVAFQSFAWNLTPVDTNGFIDIFVRDRQAGTTTMVSLDSAGGQGNGHSRYPSISGDGQTVAFESEASNLVGGDTNSASDVFVRVRPAGVTARVSVDSLGLQADDRSTSASISGDGLTVAYQSTASNLVAGDTNGALDVFVQDRMTGATSRVSLGSGGVQGNAFSYTPSVSGDGQTVAFESEASNLVAGDTNYTLDVFVHDRRSATTRRASTSSAGVEGNGYSARSSISRDGYFVAFESAASNFVPGGDTNGMVDMFVHTETLLVDSFESGDRAAWSTSQP